MSLSKQISILIEKNLEKNNRNFIIFPFGDIGMLVFKILKEQYDIEPIMICDNRLAYFNPKIKRIEEVRKVKKDAALILACTNIEIYLEVKQQAMNFYDESKILELPEMTNNKKKKVEDIIIESEGTICGRYSYGPLCNHRYVQEVGNFCSFATGSDVVVNHAIDYISTHPFIYYDKSVCQCFDEYKNHKEDRWYVDLGKEGKPKAKKIKVNKVKIGNDVWLGKNVLVTSTVSYIGNGVIAAAGAVITKNVPDYAIVAGVPAKVIRYRYNQEQIRALNRIAWWDWTDIEIRKRYDDFFIPIDEFISKYDC